MKKLFILLGGLGLILSLIIILPYRKPLNQNVSDSTTDTTENIDEQGGLLENENPLTIAALRAGSYPGSDIVIEEVLDSGSNYNRYLTSYKSEGLKIYALLTVPLGEPPANGWPAIIFNHGYIPPAEYRTTERYIAYTDGFSRNGYVLFRPDYRGHGSSEGRAEGGYGSNAYTIDVLNALASVKRLASSVPAEVASSTSKERLVDPNRMGMWGHSMGGFITFRSMVVNEDIKAGVIWAGVVASYPDLLSRWRRGTASPSPFPTTSNRGGWRRGFLERYGTPEENPQFWNSISANSYLVDISGPLQLHHGTADESVPWEFSRDLEAQMKKSGKEAELYIYEGDDHNLSSSFGIAMERSIAFFDKYVK